MNNSFYQLLEDLVEATEWCKPYREHKDNYTGYICVYCCDSYPNRVGWALKEEDIKHGNLCQWNNAKLLLESEEGKKVKKQIEKEKEEY